MIRYTHPDLPDFLSPGAFTLGGVRYTASWLRTLDAQEITALGFVEYVPSEPEPMVPYAISRRQIMTGLALEGWITEQEALDAIATGARPAAVDTVISALPEGERFHARMKWAGFLEAHRDDPLVLALAAAEGKTPQEVDDFFIMCAGIE